MASYIYADMVHYQSRDIIVYDITGREMDRHEITDNEGSWQLPLDNYAAGLYLMLLQEDGRQLAQEKLSVIR